MRRHAAIVIIALLVLLGLLVWAMVSGRRVTMDDVPEVTMGIHGPNRHDPAITDSSRRGSAYPTESRVRPALSKPGNPPVAPADPRPAEPVGKILESVARFKNPTVPIDVRRRELAELEKQGGAEAAQILMALGREHTYLNAAAVEALGSMKAPGIGAYLKKRLTAGDPLVVVAAVKGLARLEGEDAVPTIAEVLKRNRERPDGFQDTVCGACVEVLGAIGSPKGIPVLASEFKETVGPILQHDYGSKIVAALRSINHVAARPVLEAYIARLSKLERSAPDNPLGKRYIEGKIKEARDAANALG